MPPANPFDADDDLNAEQIIKNRTRKDQVTIEGTELTNEGKRGTVPLEKPQAEQTLRTGKLGDNALLAKFRREERESFNATEVVKIYKAVAQHFAAALKQPQTRAGDMELITLAAKAQDPIGSVREGDIERFRETDPAFYRWAMGLKSEVIRSGRLSPEARAEIKAGLYQRLHGFQPAFDDALAQENEAVTAFNADNEALGLPKIDPVAITGKHPMEVYAQPFAAYEQSTKVAESRAAAAARPDVVPSAPGAVPGAGATEEEGDGRTRVGLLETPPEGMHMAGAEIKTPRLSKASQDVLLAHIRDPKSNAESTAQLATQLNLKEGLTSEDMKAQNLTENRATYAPFFKNMKPEERAGVVGFDWGEPDKKSTLDAPLGQKLSAAAQNLPTSVAANTMGLMTLGPDLGLSLANGELTGSARALAHPVDSLASLGDKYTSSPGFSAWDNIQHSLITDPLAIPGDIGAGLSIGGGGLRLAGALGRTGRITNALGAAGRGLQHASGYFDPATAAGRVMTYEGGPISRGVGRVGSTLIGARTGVGYAPLDIAADVGWNAGRHGDIGPYEAFTQNRTEPGVHAAETVDMANDALQGARAEAGAYYDVGTQDLFNATDRDMVDLSQVDADLNAARPEGYADYAGLPDNERPGSHREWDRARAELDRRLALGSTGRPRANSPRRLDQMKKDVREIVGKDYGDPSYRSVMEGLLPDSISSTLSHRYPEYGHHMQEYGDFQRNFNEPMQDTFGLGATTNDAINYEASGRKLGSALRPNVNTNYGQRTHMLDELGEYDPSGNLIPALAGQATSTWTPRGIQGALFGSGVSGLGGLAGGTAAYLGATSPIAAMLSVLPLLATMSPRLMGKTIAGGARALGAGARHAGNLAESIGGINVPRLNRRLDEIYPMLMPGINAGRPLSHIEDDIEERRRQELFQRYGIRSLNLAPTAGLPVLEQ